MTQSMDNISADIHYYLHERPEVGGGDQFQVPGRKPAKGWHLLSRSPYQDCLSSGSNGKTKQDLAVEHHELHKYVQAGYKSLVKHGPCLLSC